MKIYVKLSFKQDIESDDYVIANNRTMAKIEASNVSFYDDWRITDEDKISAFEKEIASRQSAELERGIYEQYSLKEQAQDIVTLQRCLLRLKAAGVDDAESRIVTAVDKVLDNESTLDDASATACIDLAEDVKPQMSKAIGCFMKSAWVEKAVAEFDGTELTEIPAV